MARRITNRRQIVTIVVSAAMGLAVAPAHAMSGGQPVTDARQGPWMATLAVRGLPLPRGASCGGALIAPRKVLTAAHCVADVPVDELRRTAEYRVGGTTLSTVPGVAVGISTVAIDPDYRLLPSPSAPDDPGASSATHDLAVITLNRAITTVPPLPIAKRDARPGTLATLYGHGLTSPSSGSSDTLNAGRYVLLPTSACVNATPATVDPHSMRCGQGLPAQACEGDSGGPLVVGSGSRRKLVGVFSFGMETAGQSCGSVGPNFFTSTAVSHRWIERQVATVS